MVFDESGLDTVFINDMNDVLSSTRDGNDLVAVLAFNHDPTRIYGTFRIQDHFGTHPIESFVNRDGTPFVLAAGSFRGPTRATRSMAAAAATGSMATMAATSSSAARETTTSTGAPAAMCSTARTATISSTADRAAIGSSAARGATSSS